MNKIKISGETFLLIIILIISIALRVYYILHTDYIERQHDVSLLEAFHGHANYILYFIKNNFNFDKLTPFPWQFYHPPFHHMISALFVKINMKLGIEIHQAFENLQFLTLFYSLILTFFYYKILRELKLKNASLLIPFSILCFHPTTIILSGSLNNDILYITLTIGAFWSAIKWYKSPKMLTAIQIALFSGIATMTKISGILLIPAVMTLVLVKFIKDSNFREKFLGQFFAFCAVYLPAASWFSIRNMIKFKLPVTNFQLPGLPPVCEGNFLIKRFLTFTPIQFEKPYLSQPQFEYNIPLYILKTSLYAESRLPIEILTYAIALLIMNFLLAITCVISMIFVLFKKIEDFDIGLKIYFTIFFISVMTFYLKMNYNYPYFCCQDFRYIAVLMIVPAATLGLMLKFTNKYINIFIGILAFLFCYISCIIYIYIV